MATHTESDASQGGTGAPPPTDRANAVRPGLTREYQREEICVEWYASRCIHSAACIRALPVVFNPDRRPWVDVSAADPDAIAHAVTRCPTGALRFRRLDGGPQESPDEPVSITTIRNGPNYVRGAIEVLNPQTGELQRETRVALCRCGRSGHMPFCDNTHRAIGFRQPE